MKYDRYDCTKERRSKNDENSSDVHTFIIWSVIDFITLSIWNEKKERMRQRKWEIKRDGVR